MHVWKESAHVCTRARHMWTQTCQRCADSAAANRLTLQSNLPVLARLRGDISLVDNDRPRLHGEIHDLREPVRAVHRPGSCVHEDWSAMDGPLRGRRRSVSRARSTQMCAH
jgi:hypothetical protein